MYLTVLSVALVQFSAVVKYFKEWSPADCMYCLAYRPERTKGYGHCWNSGKNGVMPCTLEKCLQSYDDHEMPADQLGLWATNNGAGGWQSPKVSLGWRAQGDQSACDNNLNRTNSSHYNPCRHQHVTFFYQLKLLFCLGNNHPLDKRVMLIILVIMSLWIIACDFVRDNS